MDASGPTTLARLVLRTQAGRKECYGCVGPTTLARLVLRTQAGRKENKDV